MYDIPYIASPEKIKKNTKLRIFIVFLRYDVNFGRVDCTRPRMPENPSFLCPGLTRTNSLTPVVAPRRGSSKKGLKPEGLEEFGARTPSG
jgi:hypothetical protein